MKTANRNRDTKITTVRLPSSVYDQAKTIVEMQKSGNSSISLNDLFVTAIKAYLKMHQRRQIDAAFAEMANDPNYQSQAKQVVEDFKHSDWEALRLEEEHL